MTKEKSLLSLLDLLHSIGRAIEVLRTSTRYEVLGNAQRRKNVYLSVEIHWLADSHASLIATPSVMMMYRDATPPRV